MDQLLPVLLGKVLPVDDFRQPHFVSCKDSILPGTLLIGEVNARVQLPEPGIAILLQTAKHGPVLHPVTVQKRMKVRKIGAGPVVQRETGASGSADSERMRDYGRDFPGPDRGF